ncbi:MAG: DUF1553 domain-containing protein, partial [Planctomycetaceae bacterium]
MPKFSRRAKLAESATSGTNRAFNENIANRLWAHMFGRGLVHPVDLHHSANPPSHPELLRLLGERFAAMNFDIKAFLRELALSQAYQRPIDLPPNWTQAAESSLALVAPLEQQIAAAEETAETSSSAFEAAVQEWLTAEAAVVPVAGELNAARKQYVTAKGQSDAAQQALAQVQAQIQAKQQAMTAVSETSAKAQEAVKLLSGDQELAAAAQKFAERSQQLIAEVAALQKTLDEKTAALKAPTDALAAARQTVEAATARLQPLRDAARRKEQAMLVQRRQMITDAVARNVLDRRLETVQHLASLKPLNEAIASARQTVATRETELAAARQQVADMAAVVAQREEELKTAEANHAAAVQALAVAQQEHARRSEASQAIATAFVSTDAA